MHISVFLGVELKVTVLKFVFLRFVGFHQNAAYIHCWLNLHVYGMAMKTNKTIVLKKEMLVNKLINQKGINQSLSKPLNASDAPGALFLSGWNCSSHVFVSVTFTVSGLTTSVLRVILVTWHISTNDEWSRIIHYLTLTFFFVRLEFQISVAVSEHKKLVETSGRLQRMVPDKENFVDSLLKARQASHEVNAMLLF